MHQPGRSAHAFAAGPSLGDKQDLPGGQEPSGRLILLPARRVPGTALLGTPGTQEQAYPNLRVPSSSAAAGQSLLRLILTSHVILPARAIRPGSEAKNLHLSMRNRLLYEDRDPSSLSLLRMTCITIMLKRYQLPTTSNLPLHSLQGQACQEMRTANRLSARENRGTGRWFHPSPCPLLSANSSSGVAVSTRYRPHRR
jgi:hypothetical protein